MVGGNRSRSIDAAFLRRCLGTLEHALAAPDRSDANDIEYDVFRAACVKEFAARHGLLTPDACDWALLPAGFRRRIERKHVVLYGNRASAN